MRTALTALIAFMPTPGLGAVGAVEYTKEERAALALASRARAPEAPSPAMQAVIDRLHATLLRREAEGRGDEPAPGPSAPSPEVTGEASRGMGTPVAAPASPSVRTAELTQRRAGTGGEGGEGPPAVYARTTSSSARPAAVRAEAVDQQARTPAGEAQEEGAGAGARVSRRPGNTHATNGNAAARPPSAARATTAAYTRASSSEDVLLTRLAYLLAVAIGLIIVRKVIRVVGRFL